MTFPTKQDKAHVVGAYGAHAAQIDQTHLSTHSAAPFIWRTCSSAQIRSHQPIATQASEGEDKVVRVTLGSDARWAGLSVSQTVDLLGFSRTKTTSRFTDNVRGQRMLGRCVGDNRKSAESDVWTASNQWMQRIGSEGTMMKHDDHPGCCGSDWLRLTSIVQQMTRKLV